MKWIFVLLLGGSQSLAQVQIAFLEKFSHVAISYKGEWLHTHPYWGVELVSKEKLQKMGVITEIMKLEDRAEPSEDFVRTVLGKPYDHTYTWESDAYYCSKLVGIILGLQTKPMKFEASYWPASFHRLRGLPGLSPEDVYRQLLMLGYRPQRVQPMCSSVF